MEWMAKTLQVVLIVIGVVSLLANVLPMIFEEDKRTYIYTTVAVKVTPHLFCHLYLDVCTCIYLEFFIPWRNNLSLNAPLITKEL